MSLTPEQARTIAKDAYIYGFPMVDSYRIQYSYFVDKKNPECKGDWNQVHNSALTIYIQNASPGPGQVPNWLPAPPGPFTLYMRLYSPKPEALDGRWQAPKPVKAQSLSLRSASECSHERGLVCRRQRHRVSLSPVTLPDRPNRSTIAHSTQAASSYPEDPQRPPKRKAVRDDR